MKKASLSLSSREQSKRRILSVSNESPDHPYNSALPVPVLSEHAQQRA